MDQRSVKELFALQSKVDDVPAEEKQRAKAKTWCLVYWIDDKQVSIESLACVEESSRKEGAVSNIRFRDGKKYPGKILRINEDKKLLKDEQAQVVESFEQHGSGSGQNDVPSKPSKRIPKKPSKLSDFTCHLEEEEEEQSKSKIAKAKHPKKADSRDTTCHLEEENEEQSTTKMAKAKHSKKADSRDTKLQQVVDKAKVQQALFMEMLTCKPTNADTLATCDDGSSDVVMDDLSELEAASSSSQENQVAALTSKVEELENKLKQKELEIARLKESTPHPFSVAITPKKVKLMREMTEFLQSAQSRPSPPPPPQLTSTCRLPTTPTGPTTITTTSASSSQKEPLTVTDEPLTPLYPDGIPLLSEKEKRLAFSKGTNKEALLFSLLLTVFGEERLSKGKACGLRTAHNSKSEESTVPLDADKLHEIKECVLQRFKLSTGQPCFTPKEFNEKINQKCSTVRRALKKKQEKH